VSGSAYSHQQSAATGGSMMGGSMMGGSMMDQQQMMNVHKGMHENQELMAQIRTEKDADKRNELMQQHMAAMQAQMQTMEKMMGSDDQGQMSSEAMPETMEMMEMMNMRMDMMQMMMTQMMEHQSQDQQSDD
jgi:hypothetical protein